MLIYAPPSQTCKRVYMSPALREEPVGKGCSLVVLFIE